MKKYLIVAALSALALASVAGAQSYTFSNNLMVGSRGADVANLQSWLISNGFDIPAVSAGVTAKGYFGSQTKLAVMRFQGNNGIPNTGFVGPQTLSLLNRGGIINPSSSITVISPNGGENWQSGTQQLITWNAPAYFRAAYADIRLVPYRAPCTTICPLYMIAPYTIASNLSIDNHSYGWTVGNIQAMGMTNSMPGYAMNTAPPGQYTIQICETGTSNCDSSNSTFTIYSGSNNGGLSPVINGIDAPTTLSVGQTGTWTVRATDPQNSPLSYSVDWGDTALCPSGYSCVANGMAPAASQLYQNTTFTHSFASTGNYTIRFTVRNSNGLSAQTSSTVQVGTSNTAGPLRIISPNGGEFWQRGATQTIQWTSPAYFRATYADLKLVPYYQPCTGYVCPMTAQSSSMQTSMMYPYRAPYTIASNISINQNSYSWSVGIVNAFTDTFVNNVSEINTVPDGQYQVQICETGTSNCDSSDSPFTISGGSASSITVASPNGGEVWQRNSTHQISWNVNYPTGLNGLQLPIAQSLFDLYLDQANIYCITAPCGSTYVLDRNIPLSTPYNWIVATDVNNMSIPASDYKVRVCYAGSTANCDASNSPFTITSY